MKKMTVKEAKLWEQYEEAGIQMVAAMDRGDKEEEEKWSAIEERIWDKLKEYVCKDYM